MGSEQEAALNWGCSGGGQIQKSVTSVSAHTALVSASEVFGMSV